MFQILTRIDLNFFLGSLLFIFYKFILHCLICRKLVFMFFFCFVRFSFYDISKFYIHGPKVNRLTQFIYDIYFFIVFFSSSFALQH